MIRFAIKFVALYTEKTDFPIEKSVLYLFEYGGNHFIVGHFAVYIVNTWA